MYESDQIGKANKLIWLDYVIIKAGILLCEVFKPITMAFGYKQIDIRFDSGIISLLI